MQENIPIISNYRTIYNKTRCGRFIDFTNLAMPTSLCHPVAAAPPSTSPVYAPSRVQANLYRQHSFANRNGNCFLATNNVTAFAVARIGC